MPVGCRCAQNANGRREEGENSLSSVNLRGEQGSQPDEELNALCFATWLPMSIPNYNLCGGLTW